jgi:tetratricopeptide (TPR) repeat protein
MSATAPADELSLAAPARRAAEQARARYDYAPALALYTAALDALGRVDGDSPAEVVGQAVDLLLARAACFDCLARGEAQIDDLDSAEHLAEAARDQPRQAWALVHLLRALYEAGRTREALSLAEPALAAARASGDPRLQADALSYVGSAHFFGGDQAGALRLMAEGLAVARQAGYAAGEAFALRGLAFANSYSGQHALAQEQATQGLAKARESGDRQAETEALSMLGVVMQDLALRRDYGEQALTLCVAVGNRKTAGKVENNLALVYYGLGLNRKAQEHARRAVAMSRESRSSRVLTSSLDTLGRCETDGAAARTAYEEILRLYATVEAGSAVPFARLGLGRLALAHGHLAQARTELEAARAGMEAYQLVTEQATAEAWLGLVSLAEGDWAGADRLTAQALARVQGHDLLSPEYPVQEIYWCRSARCWPRRARRCWPASPASATPVCAATT